MDTQSSMTYSTMPTFEEFDAAFDRECPSGRYSISLGSSDSRAVDGFRLGDGQWTSSELYAACQEIVNATYTSDADGEWFQNGLQDAAMNLVSSILGTLGFEWV